MDIAHFVFLSTAESPLVLSFESGVIEKRQKQKRGRERGREKKKTKKMKKKKKKKE